MKIRKGFVSNSSSSSFIIGLAKVQDIVKCRKYMKDNGIEDVDIMTYKEIKNDKPWDIDTISSNEITIESFNGCLSTIDPREFKDGTFVLVHYFCGNEGDWAFQDREDGDDDWCEINYDIDYSFFEKKEQNIIDMLINPKAAGLDKEQCDVQYGAARNG